MVTTRKQTAAEARRAALQSEYAPLYAVAGLTDALTGLCKAALVDTQERVADSLAQLQRRGAGARQHARANADDLRSFVVTLPGQVKNLPEATRARIDDLQRQASALKVQADSTYGKLAGRGKLAVDEATATAWNLSGQSPAKKTPAKKAATANKATAKKTAVK